MNDKCISEPISWLRLEQRALGDLSPEVLRETEAHLAACAACRAAAGEIRGESGSAQRRPQRVPGAWRRVATAAGVFAAAAGILLYLSRSTPESGERSKGAGVVLRAIVELRNDGSIPPAARTKLLVTCARQTEGPWDIAVIENGTVSYPLAAAASFACGNETPYPAALVLTGDAPIDVCVLHGKDAERNLARNPEAVRTSGACTSVTPNPRN